MPKVRSESETASAHLAHLLANEKAVIERVQLFGLRELVGGSDHADEGHRQALVAVVEEALVEQREQRVENRAVRFEDLVYKRYVRLRCAEILSLLRRCVLSDSIRQWYP
jgi:hypothetical protein